MRARNGDGVFSSLTDDLKIYTCEASGCQTYRPQALSALPPAFVEPKAKNDFYILELGKKNVKNRLFYDT